ncbi:sulfite exporter TauE/SafE family protein [Sphingobium nicotianae]|uniref:Probable membrane transporter protein n=1 Tax=Sphingobium nicotianae TaxID=2782607 RepID=A0A9X1ISQ1_9SPHN|nr:sulfite exporter TauE/SafE family protein [Sphingobium nicotianae]MBT2188821.1 sulfite exporter TauE/SafE family protein [Sphingobium nicotianae]
MDLAHGLSGLLVGVLVGMTGVGGGSLMAPILILLLGVAPATAVGTDLWFAAITKSVGGAIHHSLGEPDWQVVRRLAMGSLPASIATSLILAQIDTGQIKQGLIISALGVILLMTAAATFAWGRVQGIVLRLEMPIAAAYRKRQPGLTVAAGALLGVMVTLTSIGAGALGAVMLMALYPVRMTARRLVGTDIVHAVPLTVVAGIGHLVMGNVDLPLLGSLLIGSVPGIVIGSLLATRLSASILRPVLALVLAATGLKMILS